MKENHEKELNESRKINDEVFQQNYDLQVKVDELQHLAELSCRTCMPIQNDVVNLDKEPLEKQIQSLKFELAKKISINVEIEEAQEEMKVKLAAIQQLSQNLTAETADLKKKNENLQRELLRAKLLVNEYREKASVIQAQVQKFKLLLENMMIYYSFFSVMCFKKILKLNECNVNKWQMSETSFSLILKC